MQKAGKKKARKGPRKRISGRPTKYEPEHVSVAEELCRERGYTIKNLAQHFKVAESSIKLWKRLYSDFSAAIKKGKDEFDTQVVEQSLLKRALGYSYDETTREPAIEDNETEEKVAEKPLVVMKVVTKQLAPDVTAQIFWLKNRQPQRWSDKKEIDHRIEGITKPLTEEELLERLKKVVGAGTGLDMKSIEGVGNGSSNEAAD